jgi:sterol 3beta-glucosyltransferase
MRWPRVIRKSRVQADTDIFRASSNGDAPQDISHDDLSLRPPQSIDPGLSRMFTDAALYERVLAAGPESIKNCLLSNPDDGTLPICVGSFNELIGRDLGDDDRVVTGRLAKLSVNNWACSTDDPFGVDGLAEEEQGGVSSPDGAEDEKQSGLSAPPTLEEEQFDEPTLTPEEIVDLLEQEFGALAPPGEEKLLLETDAAFFKDVVVLVGPTFHTQSVGLHFPVIIRVLFTSLHIDSLFTLHSYRLSQATTKKSSSLAQR